MHKQLLGLAVLLLACSAPAVGSRHPFPCSLTVQTVWEETAPPRTLIGRFESDLLDALFDRGCYEALDRVDPGERPRGDLLLRITFVRFNEEVHYEASIDERIHAPDEEVRRMLAAEFSAAVRLELLRLPEERVVRSTSTRIEHRVRPKRPGEDDDDARMEARRRGIRDLVRHAAFRACRGSKRALEKRR